MGILTQCLAGAALAAVRPSLLAIIGLVCAGAGAALAGSVAPDTITIVDQHGEPLEYAVLELLPPPGSPERGKTAVAEPKAVMQENRTFTPFVSAVPAGTALSFPNLDKTRHHVYSFSQAKPFELKLFVGHDHAPVLFDKPGIVVIGCNIHDYMQAYIYVGSSSSLAVSDAKGKVVFSDLPKGSFNARLWHPWSTDVDQTIVIEAKTPPRQVQVSVERRALPAPPQGGLQNLFQP